MSPEHTPLSFFPSLSLSQSLSQCGHSMQVTQKPKAQLTSHTPFHRHVCYSLLHLYRHVYMYRPNLSSPKLPQPIFFPTLKLGPTIRTELWLELTSREPREEVVPCDGRLPSLSLRLPFLLVPPRDAITAKPNDRRAEASTVVRTTDTTTKLTTPTGVEAYRGFSLLNATNHRNYGPQTKVTPPL